MFLEEGRQAHMRGTAESQSVPRSVWIGLERVAALVGDRGGCGGWFLEEVQWLWRWQTHFRSPRSWGDRQTQLLGSKLQTVAQVRHFRIRNILHFFSFPFLCLLNTVSVIGKHSSNSVYTPWMSKMLGGAGQPGATKATSFAIEAGRRFTVPV